MVDSIIEAIVQHGIFAAMVLYFVWQSWRRETRLALRIEHLEDTQKKMQVDLIRKTTGALTEATITLQHNSKVMNEGIRLLDRVCNYLDRAELREPKVKK